MPYRHEALHMPWNGADAPAWIAHQRLTTCSFLQRAMLQLAAVAGSRTWLTGWTGPMPRSPRQESQTSSAGQVFPKSLKRTAKPPKHLRHRFGRSNSRAKPKRCRSPPERTASKSTGLSRPGNGEHLCTTDVIALQNRVLAVWLLSLSLSEVKAITVVKIIQVDLDQNFPYGIISRVGPTSLLAGLTCLTSLHHYSC